MSFAAMGELENLLQALAQREDVNVVVLTGGVPGYFVAHADLDDLSRLGRGEPVEGDPLSWTRTLALIESMSQPVVAAINGQAWGGGCELSLACTLRVAATSAHMGQPEVNVGIIPGAGGTQRLPRLIGSARAKDLIYSGRQVRAEEAKQIGLVDHVYPPGETYAKAVEMARGYAHGPLAALRAAKVALNTGARGEFRAGTVLERELFADLFSTEDQKEGMRSLLEEGPGKAKFSGR